MSLGTFSKQVQAANGTAGPFFFYTLAFAGESSYQTGGSDFLTPFRAATHGAAQVLGIVANDCGGYEPKYVYTPPTCQGTTGTFALSEGDTLLVKVDRGDPQLITFRAAGFQSGYVTVPGFANIAAATAAEVVAAIAAQLAGADVVVASSRPTIKGHGQYLQVTGGSCYSTLGFSLTESTDAGLLKVYQVPAAASLASAAPLVEIASGSLAGTTFNVLVIAR